MFLSVREMELSTLRFEESFSPGEIDYLDTKLWQASPLQVSGSAELVPDTEAEVRICGHLRVRMEAECDRCLELASFPIDFGFDLFYEPAASYAEGEEVEIDPGETEIGFYEGDGLVLEEVLREQVLLALPMQRVCREGCRGICPVCGQNRNLAACGCQLKLFDDRWVALRNL